MGDHERKKKVLKISCVTQSRVTQFILTKVFFFPETFFFRSSLLLHNNVHSRVRFSLTFSRKKKKLCVPNKRYVISYIGIIFRLLNESWLPLGNTPRPRNYWWKVSDPTRLVTIWEKPRDLRNCRCHFSVSFTNSPRSLFREPLGKFRLAPIAWPIPAAAVGQLQL